MLSSKSTAARAGQRDCLDLSEGSAVKSTAAGRAHRRSAAVPPDCSVTSGAKPRVSGILLSTTAGETTPKPPIRLSGGSAPRYLKRGDTAAWRISTREESI